MPEEFTRQLLIQFLRHDIGVGFGRMMVEKQSDKSGMRYDLAIMHTKGHISLIAECKSFLVNLSEQTAFQLAKYNKQLDAAYSLITNGRQTFIWKNNRDMDFISEIEVLKEQL